MQGPNFCWHIDGNDKLLPYGFAIHGCIDGYVVDFYNTHDTSKFNLATNYLYNSFSRKILWLEVSSTNKNSSVIAGYYLKAVEKHG